MKRSGFTLIELIFVIAILALIGTTVVGLVKGRLSGGTQEAPTYVDPTYAEPEVAPDPEEVLEPVGSHLSHTSWYNDNGVPSGVAMANREVARVNAQAKANDRPSAKLTRDEVLYDRK